MARRHAAFACTVAAAFAGCGDEPAPLSEACTGDRAVIVRALAAAPGAVVLPDGTTLSRCLADGTGDGDLQNVGIAFSGVADALRVRAREGDRAAAVQLGYLIGAMRLGAAHTNGVMVELVRRVRLVGDRLADESPLDTVKALQEGSAAGGARG